MRLYELNTPDYDLQAKYDHYNKLLFDGRLPKIPITWKAMKGVGGRVVLKPMLSDRPVPNRVRVRLGLEDKYSHYDIQPGTLMMFLSPVYKRSEQALDAILIHEMIHVYFNTNRMIGEGHGSKFEKERERCGKIVGFEIPREDSIEDLELAEKPKIKPVGVIYVENTNRGNIVSLISPKVLEAELETFKDYLPRIYPRKKINIYLVSDEVWSEIAMRYPISRKSRPFKSFVFDKPESIADLKANGQLLASL